MVAAYFYAQHNRQASDDGAVERRVETLPREACMDYVECATDFLVQEYSRLCIERGTCFTAPFEPTAWPCLLHGVRPWQDVEVLPVQEEGMYPSSPGTNWADSFCAWRDSQRYKIEEDEWKEEELSSQDIACWI